MGKEYRDHSEHNNAREDNGVKFEDISSKIVEYGNGKFVEIARKKAISPEGENEFVSICQGKIKEGKRIYKNKAGLSLPPIQEVVDGVAEHLKSML